MTGDDELKAFLPEPPPPAPKRREAAITEALARFDGTPSPAPRPQRVAISWWKRLQRPQIAFLATAALVATISLPFAWTPPDRGTPAAKEQVSRSVRIESPPALRDVEVPAAAPLAEAPLTAAPPTGAKDDAPRADNLASAPQPMLAPPARPAAAPPAPIEQQEPLVVQGRKMVRPVAETPLAVSALSSERVSDDNAVVVTGTRIAPRRSQKRGDWNACTLNDPGQTLSKCRKMANRGSKDVRNEADTHLSSGLTQAWQGDLDGAISAFDRAIAIAPDLSVAYLNRGLAYERQGDRTRAIADLDRAVQYAPRSARAVYNRSVILRKYGENRRADRDEERAIALDPQYQAIIR